MYFTYLKFVKNTGAQLLRLKFINYRRETDGCIDGVYLDLKPSLKHPIILRNDI